MPKFRTNEGSDIEVLKSLERTSDDVEKSLERFRLKEALERVVELARAGNRYLNDRQPWKTYKADKLVAGQSLGIAAQIVATVGVTLQPFLPQTSSSILEALSQKKLITWKHARKSLVRPGTKVRKLDPLFHKVSASELRAKLEQIRSNKPIEAEA